MIYPTLSTINPKEFSLQMAPV